MQTDTETARSLLNGIDDSGLSSAASARTIRNAYYRGMNGVKFEDTPGYSDAAKLPETQRRAAWEAGKQRRAAKVREQSALIDSGKAGTRESGVTMQESAKSIRSLNKQQQTGMAAAESKGISYDSLLARQLARLSEMEEYKNLSETELQDIAYDETIAEMSETILTDTDAANRLSQQIYKQDRTLWQKIKDFFTWLVEKLRNAYRDSDPDSDIGRMLKRAVQDNAEIAQAWAEAVSEAGENYQLQDGQKKNARGGEWFSLRGTTDGQTVAVVDEDILSNIDLTQWNKQTKKKVQAAAKEALKKFSDGIVVDGITRNVNRVSRREFAASDYSEMLSKKAPQLFVDKMRTASAIDDVVIATTDWARDGKLKHPRTDNFVDFDHGRVLIKAGENQYSAEVVVGITDNGTAVFYDVVDIQPAHFQMQKEESPTDVTTNKSPDVIHGNSSEDTLPQQAAEVKGNVRYTSRTDSTGRALSEAQAKYFENSEVRDEDGNLLPVYHRTDSEFYRFDRNRLGGNALGNATDAAMAATALVGHWFSDHDIGDTLGGREIQSYIHIENPYSTSLAELAEAIREHAENAEQMQDDYEYGDYITTRQAADAFVDWLRENGYDGLIVTDEEFGGNSYV